MSVGQQYTEILRQGQDVVRSTVDTWTRSLTAAAGRLPGLPGQADAEAAVEAAVDGWFDLTGEVLDAQRDLAKHLVGSASTVASAAQGGADRAEPVTEPAA
ncbi:hypothetical protein OF117_00215 [Geodermatophilus sp. YIM 151500]|uniref:hypothetical protein n=1 Tax=Geodermatophilus sp. YIM 151500 TaxID=2984531 RepID=UPI0021E361A8|nr:hypothetical protein [Geodermatophilus sp. YIM 151500]MCV2487770.1 hypothetical protein [Geodermatophilus sp. YIM 151500]